MGGADARDRRGYPEDNFNPGAIGCLIIIVILAALFWLTKDIP
jgi:hypothetical protein